MRSYLICDDKDTLIGMRLGGIEGVLVNTRKDILDQLKKVLSDDSVGIVIITESILLMAEDEIMKIKLEREYPLITAIPGRDVKKREDYISKYIRESIGIKI
ncbi:MAG: V-type ATP synthase subunit F [Maledivibacter sp.]|jgi:V/A-type H+-transporting ATPase subunit F|nr:V-type ATP synthase subunit F [Maledivibacter sp.]